LSEKRTVKILAPIPLAASMTFFDHSFEFVITGAVVESDTARDSDPSLALHEIQRAEF
jgi:hypothetical protein